MCQSDKTLCKILAIVGVTSPHITSMRADDNLPSLVLSAVLYVTPSEIVIGFESDCCDTVATRLPYRFHVGRF